MKHIARRRFGQHFLTDPGVIELSGAAEHPALIATGNEEDELAGWALAVSETELPLVDAYEAASHYRRTPIRLKSGRDAYVYIHEG